jgi:predicted RNase H-like HicB family nuclease
MVEKLTILLEPIEDGWWLATIPEVPGAISQGRTKDEARTMVLDALEEVMIARREHALREAKPTVTVESFPMAG